MPIKKKIYFINSVFEVKSVWPIDMPTTFLLPVFYEKKKAVEFAKMHKAQVMCVVDGVITLCWQPKETK